MSEQGDMFRPFAVVPEPVADTHAGRPYQVEASARIIEELATNRSTLLVMATGTGKTFVGADVISKWPGRVLWLAHRDELIEQAIARIERQTGLRVGKEKAQEFGSKKDDVVVASVQTLHRESRRSDWAADHFGLVIVDEAHHAPADSYRKILDHFGAAKVLGVTATPDRGDRLALGAVFDSVAFVYDIKQAIDDGYLCPIRCTSVLVESMSLADVGTVAGDFNQGELDAVMSVEKVLHEVVKPTIELAGDRRTLVFTTSVANAHRMAEVFCRYKPESANAVDGRMEMGERRRTIADHQAGRFQFLINVGVFTEGYDDPAISCVVVGRPTKSRALYAQMVGRGTRILPGKTDLLVLDMIGQAGRHKLVTAVDVLAGKYPDDVVEEAKQIVIRNPGIDAENALAQAEAKLAREEAIRKAAEGRRLATARVQYATRNVDPFGVLHVSSAPDRYGGQFGSKPATDKQIAALGKWKVPIPENCTLHQASTLMNAVCKRADLGLASFGQMKVLAEKGYNAQRMYRDTASRLLDAIKQNGWKRLPLEQANAIIGGAREPGEEG